MGDVSIPNNGTKRRVVVVGLGMVAISFIEKLLKLDAESKQYEVTVIGEENYLAYNSVDGRHL